MKLRRHLWVAAFVGILMGCSGRSADANRSTYDTLTLETTDSKSSPRLSLTNSGFYKLAGNLNGEEVEGFLTKFDSTFSGIWYASESVRYQKFEGSLQPGGTFQMLADSLYLHGTWNNHFHLMAEAVDQEQTGNQLFWQVDPVEGDWKAERKRMNKHIQKLNMHYQYHLIYKDAYFFPSSNYAIDSLINFYFGDVPLSTVNSALTRDANAFFNDYGSDGSLSGHATTYEYVTETVPLWITDEYTTLVRHHYAYTGGAHGISSTSYLVIDHTTGLPLSLSSLIPRDLWIEFCPIIEEKIRRELELASVQELDEYLFVEEVLPTRNFFLLPDAIGFYYNPYEIGPYALGSIEVIVSRHEMPATFDSIWNRFKNSA